MTHSRSLESLNSKSVFLSNNVISAVNSIAQLAVIMHTLIVIFHCSESEPVCRTNISLPGNAIDTSDHIEIVCSVTFSGMWTPAFVCAPDLPGTATTANSSNHVQHRRVIAASDIDDLSVLNCSVTFFLAKNYRAMFPDAGSEPRYPVLLFDWKTPAIRIVNANSK